MIELIMYFGGGFLVASLLALVLISLVHQRAVRLTKRRFEDAIPLSMAEIQADKDNLRAEFAVTSRRLEVNVEQLKAKSTSLLGEIARKTEAISRLKSELADKTAVTDALDAKARSLGDQIHEVEQGHAGKAAAVEAMTHALDAKEAELATAMGELTENRLAADTQRVEIVVLRMQSEQCKSQIEELQVEATDAARRLFDERVAVSNATKELEEKRRTIDSLRPQLVQLEGEIATQGAALGERARLIGELQSHVGELDLVLAQRDAEVRSGNQEIGRLNAEKTSLEGLIETARNTIASHTARIDHLETEVAERDRLIGQRDAEAKALNQQIADMRDDHAMAGERLGSEKNAIERLLQTASQTLATRADRISDLEKWIAERDILVGQRDAEIASLKTEAAATAEAMRAERSAVKARFASAIEAMRAEAAAAAEAMRAEKSVVEARLANAIEAMKEEVAVAADAMRAEKSAVEAQLANAIEARNRAEADMAVLRQEAEATWRAEKRENVMLRERINDVAAQIAHMVIKTDKTGPIETILSESASLRPEAFERDAQGEAAPSGNLTERIRKLQNGASQLPTAS